MKGMSIRVETSDLAKALGDFDAGYLLTVSGQGRVKAVTVEPTVTSTELVITPLSRGSADNIAENPQVTLIFPPREPHGFTLIVDGEATVTDDAIHVSAAAAVLHRPASHADGPVPHEGCGQDCHPVGTPAEAAAAAAAPTDYSYDLAHDFRDSG